MSRTAYPKKIVVTTWRKNSKGVWVNIKSLHELDEKYMSLNFDIRVINDERTHISKIEFIY